MHLPAEAAEPRPDTPLHLGTIVIIGGGCYGTFYAGQLETARVRGRLSFRKILVVDRNPGCQAARDLQPAADRELIVEGWSPFLRRFLADQPAGSPADPPDVIVPSPLMPHLLYEWLLDRARQRWPSREISTAGFAAGPLTPYDTAAPDHTRYVSHADWMCPVHCTEPARCPVIRGPRTWEMAETMERWTERLNRERPTRGPVLLQCRHTVFGVGTFSVASVIEGDRIVADAGASGEPVDVLVATISSCHGAANLLRLGGRNW